MIIDTTTKPEKESKGEQYGKTVIKKRRYRLSARILRQHEPKGIYGRSKRGTHSRQALRQ